MFNFKWWRVFFAISTRKFRHDNQHRHLFSLQHHSIYITPYVHLMLAFFYLISIEWTFLDFMSREQGSHSMWCPQTSTHASTLKHWVINIEAHKVHLTWSIFHCLCIHAGFAVIFIMFSSQVVKCFLRLQQKPSINVHITWHSHACQPLQSMKGVVNVRSNDAFRLNAKASSGWQLQMCQTQIYTFKLQSHITTFLKCPHFLYLLYTLEKTLYPCHYLHIMHQKNLKVWNPSQLDITRSIKRL